MTAITPPLSACEFRLRGGLIECRPVSSNGKWQHAMNGESAEWAAELIARAEKAEAALAASQDQVRVLKAEMDARGDIISRIARMVSAESEIGKLLSGIPRNEPVLPASPSSREMGWVEKVRRGLSGLIEAAQDTFDNGNLADTSDAAPMSVALVYAEEALKAIPTASSPVPGGR